LVDSHAVVWAVDDPAKLSSTATAILQDPANELVRSPKWERWIRLRTSPAAQVFFLASAMQSTTVPNLQGRPRRV